MHFPFPYRLIDLTHTLAAAIPTWNGHCGFEHIMQLDYADRSGEDQFRVMQLKMHAGIGTHMDAPSHGIKGGKCIDEFLINDLCMPCIVIDLAHNMHPQYIVTVADLLQFESQYGQIPAGSCVMCKTGWEQFWDQPLKYRNDHIFPIVSVEAAKFFLDRGVNALGIDTLSPDRPATGFKVHKAFLGRGKILIENVANLAQLPPIGSYVMILPIKVQAGTEAPIRLVGLIKN